MTLFFNIVIIFIIMWPSLLWSIGIENVEDLIKDLEQAFANIGTMP